MPLRATRSLPVVRDWPGLVGVTTAFSSSWPNPATYHSWARAWLGFVPSVFGSFVLLCVRAC
jgi:hypothetical protein